MTSSYYEQGWSAALLGDSIDSCRLRKHDRKADWLMGFNEATQQLEFDNKIELSEEQKKNNDKNVSDLLGFLENDEVKDEHDTQTTEIFPEKKKSLKGKNKAFQRLHIEKIIKGGKKETTISIETLSYEFLALKLGEEPHTRKANKIIKDWLYEQMRIGEQVGTYDPEAPYNFSAWLKKAILWEIVDQETADKWWDNLED